MERTTRGRRAQSHFRIARAVRSAIQSEVLERRCLLSSAGLVAAYGFEENTGTTVADLSGNGNTGAITGATWSTAGKFGNSLSFNGTSNLVSVADSNSLDLTTGMTVEAWVFPTATTGKRDVVIKEGNNVDVYNLYARDEFSFPQADVLVSGANHTTEGAALPANTWTHLTQTYDGATLRLFVNGSQVNSITVAGAITASTGALRIGGNNLWGEWFAGRIDEVRIYNRALPQSEIQQDMNASVTQTSADTTPPQIATVTPVNGAQNVALGVNVTAQFNEAMTPATINSTTVELRSPSGTVIPATVTYSAATRSVTLDPTSNLTNVSNAYYTATVHGGASGVKDLAGNALAADFSWSFSTAAPALTDNVVISGLIEPTNIQFASDGRIFVAEKRGVIKVFHGLTDTNPVIFADLRTQVHNFWDRGLLGMVLAPNFPTDPHVWVLYTFDANIGGTAPKFGTPNTDSDPGPNATSTGAEVSGRLSILTANGDVMVPGSEQVLINNWYQQFPSHSIGNLAFGPDGALYASAGDAASFDFADYGQVNNISGDPRNEGGALRSQDLRTSGDPTGDPTGLDGSIIRINPNTGAPMPDNPLFATGSDTNAKRIIAEGLRNPFRFTFKPGTSELWVGDVGWNTWEEVNRVPVPTAKFTNFGWPAYEGNEQQSGYQGLNLPILNGIYADPTAVTMPFYTYNHQEQVVPGSGEPTGGSSITGAAFYGAGAYPQAYNGAFFFADYARNSIYLMYRGPNGDPDPNNRVWMPASGPVDLTVGPGGDVFYVDLNTGTIHRLQFFGANRPPVAVITADKNNGPSPLTVNFSGLSSSDPDPGDTLTYAWDLDNNGLFNDSTSPTPSFTFNTSGNKTVRLQVTDNHLASATTSMVISVDNSPPTAFIDTPSSILTYAVGDTISFSGHATDPQDLNLPASAFTWSLIQHHNTHTHHIQDFVGISNGSFVAPDHDYPSFLELDLTVTDSGGLQNFTSVTLQPQTVDLTFATTPPGLQLTVGSSAGVTPFTRTVIVNSVNQLSAISPQSFNATSYYLSNWSDGGAATHTINAPALPTTYTATFTTAPLPVAAYNFNETTGASTLDATGHGNTGTITGATRTTSGKYGGALTFNGTSNFVTVLDSTWLDLTSGMTLEAWVNPSAAAGIRDVLLKEGSNVDIYNMYARNAFGRPEGNVFVGASNKTAEGTALATNAWIHLATTYDGSNLILYVNGTAAATTPVTGPISTSAGALRIGGNSLWGEYFQGMIDDVRIYDQALTPTQVQSDMNTPVSSAPVNNPPIAVISATPASGPVPLIVNLSGLGSSDPDTGDTLSYAWDLDNNGLFNDSTSPTPQVTFTTSGVKTVRLQVADNHNASTIASKTITVSNPNNTPPVPVIDTPVTPLFWKDGDVLSFSGHATDAQDVTVPATALNWQWILHDSTGDHVVQNSNGVSGGNFTVPNATYPSYLNLSLTATDLDGAQATTTIHLDPVTTNLNFATSPAGLQLTVNGTANTTPFSRTVVVNSNNSVVATSSQTLGTTNYYFLNWSDGGAATHNIAAPASTTTYTANYTIASGPVAAYNFDEASGNVLDVSGNGNTGTVSGASRTNSGHAGRAMSFASNNQMVTIADSNSLDLTTGMTLEAWIYPTTNNGVRNVLMKEGTGVGVYSLYHRNSSARPEGNILVGGTTRVAQGTAGLSNNTWTHLASTYDGANLKLYVNGSLITTTAIAGSITTSTGALRIGGNTIFGQWFRGRVDDLRIYNRALTAGEITTDMNTPVVAPAVLPAMVATTAVSTPMPPPTRTAVFAKTKVISLADLVDEQVA